MHHANNKTIFWRVGAKYVVITSYCIDVLTFNKINLNVVCPSNFKLLLNYFGADTLSLSVNITALHIYMCLVRRHAYPMYLLITSRQI